MGKQEIKINVEGTEWSKAIDDAFTKVVKKVKMDGFREGKVPRNMYEQKYGKESLYMEAADALISEKYRKVILEDKIIPVVEPKVDINKVDEKGVEFTFTFITKPEVKLGEYKNLKVKKTDTNVSAAEVEAEIKAMQNKYAELVEKEGTLVSGDTAIIDFEGFNNGIPFEGGKAENYALEIGSNTFIPGFEEQLIGMKKDESKDIKVTFPADYPSADLKGKEVVFKVKINAIKERVIPELNEDFFEDLKLDGINSVETLTEMVTNNLKVRKESSSENEYLDNLLKAAAKNIKLELADEIVNEEIERMFNEFNEQLKMQGIDQEMYFKFANTTAEKIKETMKEEAKNRVTYRYMLEAIAENEKIDITKEVAEAEAQNLADKYQMKKDEFLKMFGGLEMIAYDLKMRKAIDVLKNNN